MVYRDNLQEEERRIEARQSRTPKVIRPPLKLGGGYKTPRMPEPKRIVKQRIVKPPPLSLGGGKIQTPMPKPKKIKKKSSISFSLGITKLREGARKVLHTPISIKGASVPKSWNVKAEKFTRKAKSIVEKTPGKIFQSISARDRAPLPKDIEVKGGTVITPIGRGLSVVSKVVPKVAPLSTKVINQINWGGVKGLAKSQISNIKSGLKSGKIGKPIAIRSTVKQGKKVGFPKYKTTYKTKPTPGRTKTKISKDTMEGLLTAPVRTKIGVGRASIIPTFTGLAIKSQFSTDRGEEMLTGKATTLPKPKTTTQPKIVPIPATVRSPAKPKAPTQPKIVPAPATTPSPKPAPAPAQPKTPAPAPAQPKVPAPVKPKVPAPAKPKVPTPTPTKPKVPTPTPTKPKAPAPAKAKTPAPAKVTTPAPTKVPPPPAGTPTKTETPPATKPTRVPPPPKPTPRPTPTGTKKPPPKKPTPPPPPPKSGRSVISGKGGKATFESTKKIRLNRFPSAVQWRDGSQFVVYDLNKNIRRIYKNPQGIGVNPGKTPVESIKVIKQQKARPQFTNVNVGRFKLSVASPTRVILKPMKKIRNSSIIATKKFRR